MIVSKDNKRLIYTSKPNSNDGKVKLNLGCGKRHRDGYLNIDVQEPCDLKHDLRKPLPFPDNSVDEIFTEGFIWLLSKKEWEGQGGGGFKKELERVLKPGGKLEIIFLDFEYIIKAFLDNKDGKRWGWWWQTIFSAQEDEFDFSKNAFTYEKLVSDLSAVGFSKFEKHETEDESYVRLICYKSESDRSMNVLIGTPVHEVKDYCMERWLENVSKLQYPTKLLLVDNSGGLDYLKKLEGYCKKFGLTNYEIKHLEINQNQPPAERIGRSREIIRQEILKDGFDAWFSWECDQIIPTNSLDKLANIMNEGNFTMVSHNSWVREIPGEPGASFGCALIRRDSLKKYGFILEGPDAPDCWAGGETWFKKRLLKGGDNYIEVYGIIDPIYHLKE